MRPRSRRAAAALGCVLAAAAAWAQDGEPLGGTLKKVRDSGVVTLGVREAAFPFSYALPSGRMVGYSIDLCLAIVEEIKSAIDRPGVAVRLQPLSSGQRLPAVKDGRVDLECGSTTNTRQRQQEVAFSPVIFVTGTKLMVRRGSGIRSLEQLRGRAVAVSAGTTNEAALRTLSQQRSLGLKLLTHPDLRQAYDAFEAGQADALASDEVLLLGLKARARAPRTLAVVGDLLSYEPYAIAYRRDDPQLAQVVEHSFRRLAESRELAWIYDQWFVRRLPGGEQLNLRMSPQLEAIFEGLGLPP
ncbi:amino acid ABC transporter substrate-binding protein [Azohydromonas caseinilytica]|uniref:Amino acid ABC transporter substrate-binding protein n=1 Tax=Azohydromonas caseinilytica TaxID=2728836 RepID=A0A848FH10_9BURK|nr:amino acid ABC transporter substrate-binding protein [Azohydromonas caseinilytica]NML17131.1 amino acid ABC transporter substrate-binding protein [Azohydromonas caseinilytica]